LPDRGRGIAGGSQRGDYFGIGHKSGYGSIVR
jgi:hypothetical protein